MSKELSVKQRSALQRVIDDPELQPWLFRKVSDPVWFNAFIEHGLLSPALNPKPIETKENTVHVPSWPITEFLVASSQKIKEEDTLDAAKNYLLLIRAVTKYAIDNDFGNHRTWWQFCKILRNLPISIISLDDLTYVSFWLSDKFDKHMVSNEVSEWISEIIDNSDEHSRKITLALLDILFSIKSIDSKYSNDRKEATLYFDGYQAKSFAEKIARKLGEKFGLPATVIFEQKLTEALSINANDKWSTLWRKAIEENEQNSSNYDVDNIFITLFRDSMLGYYQANTVSGAESKLINLLSSEYQSIKRIAIYIASEFFEYLEDSTIKKVIAKLHFNDKYRHELWHFLNKNFVQLTTENKSLVIDTISSLEVKNKAGELEAKATAYKQANWYASIVDVSELAKNRYKKCIASSGVEPDHPDFSCYSSTTSVINESPLTVTEMAVMLEEPVELVRFLNGYEHVGHFGEAGIEGLVETFGTLVELDDCFVLNELELFVDLKPHYLHEIFSSYLKLWTSKKQRNWDVLWPKIIRFSYDLFGKEHFWKTSDNRGGGPFIGDVSWVVSVYSRLIEAGCEKNENAFELTLCAQVKKTLEFILDHVTGSDFEEDSDAVFVAINSPRGRCLEAYFKLALYQCKNVTKNSEEHVALWATYEPVFNRELTKPSTSKEYEFITIVVMYIRNFMFLSEDWVYRNIESMFGAVNSQQWLCSVQAYSYVGRLIPEVHKLLKSKSYYLAALDSAHLKDSIKTSYIEHICIAYIQEIESLEDEKGLLQKLLIRNNEIELCKLITFLRSIRGQNNDVSKKIVFWLWPKLIDLTKLYVSEKNILASKLGLWAEYIQELDDESKFWLQEIAPFINDENNGVSFMNELARLSANDALNIADIWIATLIAPYYVYDLAPLEKMFINLIAVGKEGQSAAKKIASVYIKHDHEAVVKLYQKVLRDSHV